MGPRQSGAVRGLGQSFRVLLALTMVASLAFVTAPTARAEARPWMDTSLDADARADLLAAAMTFDQKVGLFANPGIPIPELGVPSRREKDGANGLASNAHESTAFPSGVAMASTWDTEMPYAFGAQGAQEAWEVGYSGWAAPAADMTRSPYHGRQWSSYGEDPLLGGRLPAAVVEGVKSIDGVYALPKHTVANTQESQRLTLNNVMDLRTLREVYVRQWEPIIAAAPGALMCAFPRLMGDYSCDHDLLNNQIIKGDLGFEGWISSDYSACESVQAYNLGTDFCGPEGVNGEALGQAVLDGVIPMERFDDMVHRVLRTFFEDGLMDHLPPGALESVQPQLAVSEATLARGREIAYRAGVEGSVLLKNDDILPLDANAIDSIALIGENTDRFLQGFGADSIPLPAHVTTIQEGIEARVGDGVTMTKVDGTDPLRVADGSLPGPAPIPSSVLSAGGSSGLQAQWFTNPTWSGNPLVARIEDQVNWGNGLPMVFATFGSETSPAPDVPPAFFANPQPSIRWSGQLTPVASGTYDLGLSLLGSARLWVDGEEVLSVDADRIDTQTVSLDLVAGQSYDVRIDYVADAPNQCCGVAGNRIGPAIRLLWTPPVDDYSPQIQEAVEAARNADVAVVVASEYLGEAIDRGSITLPQGQDALIRAVAAVNPNTVVVLATGGAVAVPWLDDVAGLFEVWYPGQEQGRIVASLLFGDEDFSGRLPQSWPVSDDQVVNGLGLTNPVYDINNLNVQLQHDEGVYVGYKRYDQLGLEPQFAFGYGLTYSTVEYRRLQVQERGGNQPAHIRVQVRNRGSVEVTETVQIYHGALPTSVDTPSRQLLGWDKVTLAPGQQRWVDIPIELDTPERLLSYFDAGRNEWVRPKGTVQIYAGASQRAVRLTGSLRVR